MQTPDLLKRVKALAREQCFTERADHLKDAVKMFARRLRPQPELPASLAGVNATLDDLSPLPAKISLQRKETLQQDASALEAILQKAAPFVPSMMTEASALMSGSSFTRTAV